MKYANNCKAGEKCNASENTKNRKMLFLNNMYQRMLCCNPIKGNDAAIYVLLSDYYCYMIYNTFHIEKSSLCRLLDRL